MCVSKTKLSQSMKTCIFLSYGMEESPNPVIVLTEDKVKMPEKSTF